MGNILFIQDIVEKNRSIRLNAYNYTDNLVDYEPTLITEISQIITNESIQAVEVETNGKYTGSRVDGKKSGTGKYEWKNGNVYEGEFSDDLMHGTGGSKVKGLPQFTTENTDSRLTKEEVESIKRWSKTKKGTSEIVVVRHLPFAPFMLCGEIIFFILRIYS